MKAEQEKDSFLVIVSVALPICVGLMTMPFGCGFMPDPQVIDQCVRREIMLQCLAAIPKGPASTVTNDWAEVVQECGSTAYYQSIRHKGQVKPECEVER